MEKSCRETIRRLDDIVGLIRRTPSRTSSMRTKVIAIDGRGGVGKSSLAKRLSMALEDAPIVQTDDFASWENPLDWWPSLIEEVLGPLADGEQCRYQPYDWDRRRRGQNEIKLPLRPEIVILEGVSASRTEFEPYLAFRIWIEAAAATRLERGLERDGLEMAEQWRRWMAEEDAYVARDKPIERADIVISGAPSIVYDPETEVVVLD